MHKKLLKASAQLGFKFKSLSGIKHAPVENFGIAHSTSAAMSTRGSGTAHTEGTQNYWSELRK